MKKYKIAIFDLDGTLLDTLQDLAISTNFALEMSGYPKRTLQEIRSFVGNGIEKLIERAVPENVSVEERKQTLEILSLQSLPCAQIHTLKVLLHLGKVLHRRFLQFLGL